jgi:hypothetical protein
MMNKLQNRFLKIHLIVLLISVSFFVKAQVVIKGPSCVLPGIRYHYVISAGWDSAATMQVCITGGKLKTDKTCSPSGGKPFSSVFVVWDQGVSGSVKVTSTSGAASLPVAITTELNAGQMNPDDKIQTYAKGDSSYTFHCNAASGGSCNPSYTYQWQQSTDGVNWANITGATGQDLKFTCGILYNTFFR